MKELNEAAEKAKSLFAEHKRQTVGNWVSYTHPDIPNEPEEDRMDIIKSIRAEDPQMIHHCLGCLLTSGCYFIKGEATDPQYHDHPHCHCKKGKYAPEEVTATCRLDKFTGYIFAEKYAHLGKKKLFEEDFGYTFEDSEYLRAEYERQGKEKYTNGDYTLKALGKYAQTINIVIELDAPKQGIVEIVSGWNVNPNGNISCNTPYGRGGKSGKVR